MSKIFPRLMMLILLFLCFENLSVAGQRKKPGALPATGSARKETEAASKPNETRLQSIDTSTLKAGKLFDYVYDGRFERMRKSEMKRALSYGGQNSNPNTVSNLEVALAYMAFIRAYSDICQSHLPPNKEEITSTVGEYDTQMNYLISSRGIVGSYTTQVYKGSRTIGSGTYADPKVIPAFKAKNLQVGLIFSGRFLDLLMGKQMDLTDVIVFALDIQNDNYQFLTRHGCASPTTKHFSENFLRLASGQSSLQEQNGEDSFFLKECKKKLPGIVGETRANACACINSQFKANLEPKFLLDLEDKFDAEQFLYTAFGIAGLHQKISACMR